MEDLRELLNIYFSDEEEDEQREEADRVVYENTYQSFYSSFLNEEKYITNVFENILRERNREYNNGREDMAERAYEGAGKIGGVNASIYFNDYSYETEEKNPGAVYNENYITGGNSENIQRIQTDEKNKNGETYLLNEMIDENKTSIENNSNEFDLSSLKQSLEPNLSNYFENNENNYNTVGKTKQAFSENIENTSVSENKTELNERLENITNIANNMEEGLEAYKEGMKKSYGGCYNGYNEENSALNDCLSENFCENIYNSENKTRGAEVFAGGVNSSVFAPSDISAVNNYYEEASEENGYTSEAADTSVLNNYYEEASEENSNISGAADSSVLNNYYEGASEENSNISGAAGISALNNYYEEASEVFEAPNANGSYDGASALNYYYEEAEGDSYTSEAAGEKALNYFYENGSEKNFREEALNDILNTYLENEYKGLNVTNNISPTFNLYGAEGGRDMDIEEIADKIGEMLAEAAAGSASGFYK